MSQAIVGRIFWKELRVQWAFWAWILGFGVLIQLVPIFLGHGYYRAAVDFHWFYSVNVVIGCCFAAGSTAIAFAGETENRTKSLFQRLPIRAADLIVGKLGWSFLGTYVLLLILAVTANIWGSARPAMFLEDAGPRPGFDPQAGDFWKSLLSPLPFLAVGVFCSLIFREVLTTVLVAGATAAILMGTLGSDSLVLAIVILAAVAVADRLLVPYWVQDSLGFPSLGVPRLRRTTPAPGYSTVGVRSSVAWRRAAGSLLWKEFRQAIVPTLTFAVLGALFVGLFTFSEVFESGAYAGAGARGFFRVLLEVGVTTIPLFFGIAAGRADRRDGAYRLLTRYGISPHAHWLTKHAVWLGLAIATSVGFLAWERLLESSGHGMRVSLWQDLRTIANVIFGGSGGPAGLGETLAVVLFVVALLYSLGHLLSLVIPSAMTGLVVGLIAWLSIALIFTFELEVEIPFWWTLGLLPLIFFFTGWVRTRDWIIDRNSLRAWGRAAASLLVPLFGIFLVVIVFRVLQIPRVTLPLGLQKSAKASTVAGQFGKQSRFFDAVKALTSPPPSTGFNPETGKVADSWAYADAVTRDWVTVNEPARRLALEAARQPPGTFPEFPWSGRKSDSFTGERVIDLTTLLLDSARKLESEDKLEEALENYVAAARLGDDLVRSGNSRNNVWRVRTFGPAIEAMDLWAAYPKQNSALVKRAIGIFQHLLDDEPSESEAILKNWREERRLFESQVWKGNNPDERTRVAAETVFVRWFLPGELLRLQRVQDLMFATALDEIQFVERQIRDRGFVDSGSINVDRRRYPWRWVQTTLGPPADSPNGYEWMWTPEGRVNQTALARMHFLVWAACDYRREHKKLPGALSELVPAYFSWLPIDPWTGRDFLYEPAGVPVSLRTGGRELQPAQPFIASGGSDGCSIEINDRRGETPVRVLTRSGVNVNGGHENPPLDYPAPAVAIPSPNNAYKPPGNPTTKPAARTPAPLGPKSF